MSSIVELWKTSRDFLAGKSLQQILAFTGQGKLRDGNDTCRQFRDYLRAVPSDRLIMHAQECLQESFPDSGMALQDIVNEIGFRLAFTVENGVYRGTVGGIGFDGIWTSSSQHQLVVEVKTTDAYRINLDTLSDYRKSLAAGGRVALDHSSILIVVGRQDTGDLEAQIRGSKHAWDIRLVSTDSLVNLLALKEKLNDPQTVHQISELLKPNEYTRIDKLIELMFATARDVELDEEAGDEESDDAATEQETVGKKFTPVAFHAECAEVIQAYLGIALVRQSKSAYRSHEQSVAVNLTVSKPHKAGSNRKFWFAFHPHQKEFLDGFERSYVAFGCGSADLIFLIPFDAFAPTIDGLWTTERDDRKYWHVVIHERDGRFEMQIPHQSRFWDLSSYRIVGRSSPTGRSG